MNTNTFEANNSDASGYKLTNEKSHRIASVLEDISIIIGNRKDGSINLKIGGNFETPGINLIEDAKELADLAQDIRQGIFKLIILGAFSNGKSTLINSLLGEQVLKAKALPTTSIVTMLVHGENPDVVIHYKDDKTPSRMDTNSFFKKFTLTTEDRQNIEDKGYIDRFNDIKYAQIERNYSLFKNGVRLIDSPGLEDEKSRTDLVLGYLKECKAVILVLNAQQLLTQSEREFIENELADSNFQNLFFVINKINLVDEDEVEELKEYLRAQIKSHFLDASGAFDNDCYQRRVFFVNALGALEASTRKESGIPELEKELEHFLTSDAKNTAAFERTYQRLSDVITEAHDSIKKQKETSAKPVQDLENNRIKAEKILNDLENRKKEIEELILRFGKLISEKIFSSLVTYSSELKDSWKNDSKNIQLKGINVADILLSGFKKDKITRVLNEEIKEYLKKKFKDWSTDKVPTIIKEDIDTMMNAVESQVEDFQLELIQVDNLFSTGQLLGGHELDTEKGKVSKTAQSLLSLAMLDFSGFTGTLMGRGDWGSFIGRVVVDILLSGLLFAVMGPIFGIIAYIIAELFHVGMQESGFKERLLQSVGERIYEQLPTEMSKQHDEICEQIQKQFAQKAQKLTEKLQAQIEAKRTEQQDIINQKQQQSFSVEKEQERLNRIDSKLDELLNIAGGVVGQ